MYNELQWLIKRALSEGRRRCEGVVCGGVRCGGSEGVMSGGVRSGGSVRV